MSNERRERYEVWNELCESDALWGPLVFLRPSPDQRFSHLRLLLVVTLFGSFYGLCLSLILHYVCLLGGWLEPPRAALVLSVVGTAFVCGELTFLRAWNERARLMHRREAWLEEHGARSR